MKILKVVMRMPMLMSWVRGPPGPPPIINPSFLDGSYNWKWQNMSSSPTSLHRIPSLMWTTIAASVFVGTKSITSAIPSGQYKVRPFDRRITYNAWWCGVPTIVSLAIWILLICLTAYVFISARVSRSGMKQLWNRLSGGGGQAFSTVRNSRDGESEALLNE
jgi:hypothetical protein